MYEFVLVCVEWTPSHTLTHLLYEVIRGTFTNDFIYVCPRDLEPADDDVQSYDPSPYGVNIPVVTVCVYIYTA